MSEKLTFDEAIDYCLTNPSNEVVINDLRNDIEIEMFYRKNIDMLCIRNEYEEIQLALNLKVWSIKNE